MHEKDFIERGKTYFNNILPSDNLITFSYLNTLLSRRKKI